MRRGNVCLLLATALTVACSGGGDNKSDSGDVHGDGRCTDRYISAYNDVLYTISSLYSRVTSSYNSKADQSVAAKEGADKCAAFYNQHGSVSCRARNLSTGVETTAPTTEFRNACTAMTDISKASTTDPQPVPQKPTDEPTKPIKSVDSTDDLLVESLEPSWVSLKIKSEKLNLSLSDTEALIIIDGVIKSASEWRDDIKSNPTKELIMCSAALRNLKLNSAIKPESIKLYDLNSRGKMVGLLFTGSGALMCGRATNSGYTGITLGELKKTLGKLADVKLLKSEKATQD